MPPQPSEAERDWATLDAWADRVLEDVPFQDDPYAAIDACVTQEMSQTQTPGASLAITLDGKMVYTRTTGFNPTCGVALQPNNFDCGSATEAHIRMVPIPEPSTYALMLAGLGAVGFLARRRQTASAAKASA
jgi:hypothetical protein